MLNRLRRVALRCTLLFSVAALALSGFAPAWSGDAVAESEQRLLTDIKYLASDELEGRGVGLAGLDAAADYIRDEFARAGLASRAGAALRDGHDADVKLSQETGQRATHSL